MTRTLSELLALVKQLREEVGQQRNEIAYLRQLLENCAGCKEPAAPLRDTCASNNPCYPGGLSLCYASRCSAKKKKNITHGTSLES